MKITWRIIDQKSGQEFVVFGLESQRIITYAANVIPMKMMVL